MTEYAESHGNSTSGGSKIIPLTFGDILILGLNTDDSTRRIKGPNKPINSQQERAEILSALEDINYIVFFDENDPCTLIEKIKPDIHVKGGDYNPNNYENMPEARIINEYGGQIKIVSIIEGKSTSNIIDRIKEGS